MKKQLLTAGLAGALIASSTIAFADEEPTESSPFSATLGFYSDYMFRGISQTDNGIAIQGSFDYANDNGIYAGVWGSNVDFKGDSDTSLEVDLYLGYTTEFNGVTLDFAVLRYLYPDSNSLEDFNEYKAAATISGFTASLYFTNDMFGTGESAWYINGAYSFALPMDVSLDLAIGYSDYDKAVLNNGSAPDDYMDWNIGVSKSISGFGLSLQYIDSNNNCEKMYGDSTTDGRVVFSISRSF